MPPLCIPPLVIPLPAPRAIPPPRPPAAAIAPPRPRTMYLPPLIPLCPCLAIIPRPMGLLSPCLGPIIPPLLIIIPLPRPLPLAIPIPPMFSIPTCALFLCIIPPLPAPLALIAPLPLIPAPLPRMLPRRCCMLCPWVAAPSLACTLCFGICCWCCCCCRYTNKGVGKIRN